MMREQAAQPLPAQERLARARAALASVEARVGAPADTSHRPALPVAEPVSALVPGGMKRGTVAVVGGSTSLMVALAGEASKAGSWIAMVGMPHVGVVAAARRGVDLARLALVPHPGIHAAATIAACIDGMDVVMVGKGLALTEADKRRLLSRARERGTVILSAEPWPGARVEFQVEGMRWSGLGAGDGRLRERDVIVAVRERAGSVKRVQVHLDGEPGVWRPGVRHPELADEVAS